MKFSLPTMMRDLFCSGRGPSALYTTTESTVIDLLWEMHCISKLQLFN
jgi:hypothetical protein